MAGSASHLPDVADGMAPDATPVDVISSFDDMPLNQKILRGIYSHGFEKPSPIQQRAIVPMTRGGDIIAQAQSGTGKTGAFTIGLLQQCDLRLTTKVQALVLSPTRELAVQSHDVIASIGTYMPENEALFVGLFVGGTPVSADVRRLKGGVVVACGTPGRVADLIRRGALRTDGIKVLVLDEADEMLSQGFAEQVYDIFKFVPRDVQIALFSATMPPEVLDLTKKFMRDPTRILLKKESLTLEGIKQYYVAIDEDRKLEVLMDLYESVSIAQSVIFANSRRKVDWITDQLNKHHHTVAHMHSEMERGERAKVMAAFRAGASRVLVTTDLAARGIDVQHVNIVINFELPTNKESYLHRIGRGGRFGKKGIAINFVAPRDVALLRELEAHYHTQVDELPQNFAAYFDDEV